MGELKKLKRSWRAKEIGKSMLGKYGNLQCVAFRDEFRKKLVNEGISYTQVYIKSSTSFISSNDGIIKFGDEFISTSGDHYATRGGDKIYDNIHPEGISINNFKNDIGITENPNGFLSIDGLN